MEENNGKIILFLCLRKDLSPRVLIEGKKGAYQAPNDLRTHRQGAYHGTEA